MLDSITLYVGSYLSEIGDTFSRLRGNPKFCVKVICGANRAKFIMGGGRTNRLPPC